MPLRNPSSLSSGIAGEELEAAHVSGRSIAGWRLPKRRIVHLGEFSDRKALPL